MNDELDYEKNNIFDICDCYTAMPCILLFYHVQKKA